MREHTEPTQQRPSDTPVPSVAPVVATRPRPLAGVRVLDLSRLLPGPYCSLLLADLGADVIKVETPTAGDYARMAPPELGFGGIFEAVNRGKRSLAVNYRLPRGREVVLRLAARSDVFLESSRPGQMVRRGLGPADLHAVNPGIVYCSLSGYGQTGPYRDRPGHDLDYLAVGGLLALLGPPGARPVPPGLQIADIAGGMLAAVEILASLYPARALRGRRDARRRGARRDRVLAGTAGFLGRHRRLGRRSAQRHLPVLHGLSGGRRGWLAVGALEPQFWVSFCEGIERDDLVPRQYDPTAIDEVARCLLGRTADAWLGIFDEDACVARVNLPAEAERDPQVRDRGIIVGEGADSTHRRSAHDGSADTGTGRAPGLGEHTFQVLAEAGLEAAAVNSLVAASVVAGPAGPAQQARAARLASMLARMAERERPATPDVRTPSLRRVDLLATDGEAPERRWCRSSCCGRRSPAMPGTTPAVGPLPERPAAVEPSSAGHLGCPGVPVGDPEPEAGPRDLGRVAHVRPPEVGVAVDHRARPDGALDRMQECQCPGRAARCGRRPPECSRSRAGMRSLGSQVRVTHEEASLPAARRARSGYDGCRDP